MLCPECKSNSIVIKDGKKVCEAKGCTYISFHVITYQNENRQFEGQKGTQNRFSTSNFNSQNRQKQSERYQRNFYRASTVIRQLIRTMKLSVDLQDKAESKLMQILKVKYPQQKIASESKQKDKQKDKKEKVQVPDVRIAAYCLWLACCDKKMEFKDVRIANQMGISKSDWLAIHNKMQKKFSWMGIPTVNPEQYIRRVCRKHGINSIQQNAMLEMAKNIREAEIKGGKKNATVAACIFWQIMIRSSTYNKEGQFDIKYYLEKSGRNQQQKYWRQKQFDISFDAIKKFKNEELKQNMEMYIPQFKTRMQIPEDKMKNLEDRNRN